VLPRWRALAAGDVEEKAPGELVTSVDRTAEKQLTTRLRELLPEAVVVGEEATSADPSLLAAVSEAPLAWLVDPIDGTGNFVAGSEDFAVMVALVERGDSVASWIEQPALGRSYQAVRGAGAFADGRRIRVTPRDNLACLRGAALTRFLNEEQRAAVSRFGRSVESLGPGRVCAGVDYPLIAEDEQDFVLFWRTLPWDHAPGALLLSEAGGIVAHLDGQPYRPGEHRDGLVAASGLAAHAAVASALLPE
jgi:fructose-1,6-bisphosphatase/inositol monophosphatase family enzyme